MARTNPRFNTVAVAVITALTLGFASTFFSLKLSSSQAYADVGQVQIILGSTQATSELKITLTPQRTSNPVGDLHDLTATVTSEATGSLPAPDILVSFSVISGPTVGVTGSDTTDAQGEAFFSYTATSVGLDTIQACVTDSNSKLVCDLAIKNWVDAPPPPDALLDIDLTPDSATNTVGDQHDLTATVTSATPGTTPAPGIAVTFEVISGPTSGVTGSSTTDVNGDAFFSYTGNSVGQDTIQSCFNDSDAGRVCDQATKEWVAVAPPPSGNSCQGEHSCRGKNISIGDNSCNAEDACNGNNIVVGDNSCNGEKSCRGNSSVIGDNSCSGEEACRGNRINVGDGSCNGEESCRGNRINVGDGSCNEEESCRGNRNNIGNNSCNGEDACRGNHNYSGNNSCNGEDACRINNSTIPNDSCNEEDACSGRRHGTGGGGQDGGPEIYDEEDEHQNRGKGKAKKGKDKDNDHQNSDLDEDDEEDEHENRGKGKAKKGKNQNDRGKSKGKGRGNN